MIETNRRWTDHFARTLGMAIVAALTAWFCWQTVRFALEKNYTIDEYQYAHAAWLMSNGELPFKDFYLHQMPLLCQVMSVPFKFLDDDPNNIIYLRWMMLPITALVCAAAWVINAGKHKFFGIVAVLMMLSVRSLSMRLTEIRPDPLAFGFFLSALACLYCLRGRPKLCGFLSGLLLTAALWSSLKVCYYGLVFPAALIADVFWHRKQTKAYLLGHPGAFVLGFFTACIPIAAYLTLTGLWSQWYAWCIVFAFEHQRDYPGFTWWRYIPSTFLPHWWLLPLAIAGLWSTWRRCLGRNAEPIPHPDLLLLGALVSTFLSFVWQKGPYPYSLVPFLGILCIFAARGVAAAWTFGFGNQTDQPLNHKYVAILLTMFVAGQLYFANAWITERLKRDNVYQHEVWAKVNELTDPGDVAYDNAGRYISRPHAHYYFYTDMLLRKKRKYRQLLAREVPAAIRESGCVLLMRDSDRFGSLPRSLRGFLNAHFQPYNGDIRLWGRRYEPQKHKLLESTFEAIRDGKYFIEPAAAVTDGSLIIEDQLITEPVFELAKGIKTVHYLGDIEEFYLLWLPRNGETYRPDPKAKPRAMEASGF